MTAAAAASPALYIGAFFAVLLRVAPAAGACLLPGEPAAPVRPLELSSVGISLSIPDNWSEVVERHAGVVRVFEGRDRGCRLTLTVHRGADTAPRIRRVHERLFLGSNALDDTCGPSRIEDAVSRPGAAFGEYAPRSGRSRIYAMFWSTGTDGFAALLSCRRGGAGDWRTALAIFRSIVAAAP